MIYSSCSQSLLLIGGVANALNLSNGNYASPDMEYMDTTCHVQPWIEVFRSNAETSSLITNLNLPTINGCLPDDGNQTLYNALTALPQLGADLKQALIFSWRDGLTKSYPRDFPANPMIYTEPDYGNDLTKSAKTGYYIKQVPKVLIVRPLRNEVQKYTSELNIRGYVMKLIGTIYGDPSNLKALAGDAAVIDDSTQFLIYIRFAANRCSLAPWSQLFKNVEHFKTIVEPEERGTCDLDGKLTPR